MMYEPYLEMWARSVASTHALYRDHGGALVYLEKLRFLDNDELMLKCAMQAVEIVPSYNECWVMLARANELSGDVGEAVELYEKAAKCSENPANNAKFYREADRVGKLLA